VTCQALFRLRRRAIEERPPGDRHRRYSSKRGLHTNDRVEASEEESKRPRALDATLRVGVAYRTAHFLGSVFPTSHAFDWITTRVRAGHLEADPVLSVRLDSARGDLQHLFVSEQEARYVLQRSLGSLVLEIGAVVVRVADRARDDSEASLGDWRRTSSPLHRRPRDRDSGLSSGLGNVARPRAAGAGSCRSLSCAQSPTAGPVSG